MRLVIDGRSIHDRLGGIGRVTWGLADAIGREPRSHEIVALVGPRPPAGFSLPGVRLHPVDGAMIDEPFEQLLLPTLLERLRADLYLNPCFSLPALRTTRFQLSILHDVVFEDRPDWVEPRLRHYLSRWSRFAAAHADRVLTVSDHARSRIRDLYGVDALRVYNGLAEDAFVRPEIVPSDPYLLYLGALEPKKGLLELLDAFSRLDFPGSLLLAGAPGGPPFDWDGLIARTPRVRRLGYVDEAAKKTLLAGASLFVYPSLYEGFGLPPLEAMALGVPCVTSDSTSLPEVVGNVALTVDVRDPDAFAETLRRGLQDDRFRRRARRKGPEWARRFSWDRAASEILDLCESLEAAG